MSQTKAELIQTKKQGAVSLGDADSSHSIKLKAPATVAADRTWTLPSVDPTANQVLRGNASTPTTLEWGTVDTSVANDSVGAAKTDLSIVQGDIIYGTGADAWARLAKGAADQVLTMNSGATAPEWAAAGGGAITRMICDTDSTEFVMTNSNDPYRLGGASGFELSFTPPSVNTSYLLVFKICMHRDSDDGQWGLQVKNSTDNWNSYHHEFGFMHPSYGGESDVKERGVFMAMKEYKPGTTSALKMGVWGQIWSGDSLDITFNGHSGSSMMVAFELDDNKKVGDWG